MKKITLSKKSYLPAALFGILLLLIGAALSYAATLTVTATAGSTYVDLSWEDGVEANQYEIYRDTASSVDTGSTLVEVVYGKSVLKQVYGGSTSFVNNYRDNNVQAGTTYYYIIRAVDDNGSRISDVVSAGPFGKMPHGHYADNPEACGDCHQAHTADSEQLVMGPTVNETCYRCHSGSTPLVAGTAHDIESEFSKPGSNHLGLDGEQQCSSCHDAHFDPAADPALLYSVNESVYGSVYHRGGGSDYCFTCHDVLQAEYQTGSAHDSSSLTPPDTNIVCSGCHEPHGSSLDWLLKLQPYGAAQATLNEDNDFCYTCHDENSILDGGDFYDAVTAVSGTYLHDTHVTNNNAQCRDCHDAHGADPAENSSEAYLISFSDTVSGVVYSVYSSSGDGPLYQLQSEGGYCVLNCHNTDHDEASSVYDNVYNP
ncbi:cytochrome c3 family protein [Metallumcola ferriviriculae]|uniref:Cytochrome c3 family protein n=1 Tax=Metallumcola ferriviriculae TaxID=3039180 RepID=A0AAU0UQ76_9FIRM|nr:cytochrome c3 family protein [Desulfitibacteraceae bacterium MK1]